MDTFAAHFLVWVLASVLPISALAAIAYFFTSRPLHREEHARLLVELVESAIEQGVPVERYIVSLAETRDASLGARFHLLAAYLQQGRSLAAALEKVPALAPPQLAAMLEVGEQMGDYRRVLPACRELLRDGVSESRALINYQVGFAFLVNPMIACLLPFIGIKAMPIVHDITKSFAMHLPWQFQFLERMLPCLCILQMLAVLAIYVFSAFCFGGPRLMAWMERSLTPVADRMMWQMPWRRKRLLRDFSAMLGLLLDARLPEEQAVKLAAQGTANATFVRMGNNAARKLREGAPLPEALRCIDDGGEFEWRMKNAGHGGGNFFQALNGWHRWLRVKAFQEEQAAAQTISTSLLLLNAVSVAAAATLVLGSIVQLSNFVK